MITKLIHPLLVSLALCLAATAQNKALPTDLLNAQIHQIYPEIEQLYYHLHTHPELSFHEEKTARRIAAELAQTGFHVTPNVGGHGVVGVLENGPGPTILVRTDLDALPVKELTGLPYASSAKTQDDLGNEVSMMHACGHDAHMAVFIGSARLLVHFKDRWQGTLVWIAQPAEERGAGAKAMLADGLLTRFPTPDVALALHLSAELPAGSVSLTPGAAMANVDSVDITIPGVGGHGAFPHKTKDPITLAAQTILALQTIVSREIDPLEPAVVSVGSIHAGTKHNIIPDEAKLQVTVRSFTDTTRQQTLDAIARIARGTALAAGMPAERMPIVTVSDEYTPAVHNDPELTQRLHTLFAQLLGPEHVIQGKPVMGGEDFGRYGRTDDRIPICIYFLGAVDPATFRENQRTQTPLPSLHSPFFAPLPKPTLQTGILTMTTAVLDLASK